MSNKNEITLHVEGMTCSSCVRHVEGALRQLNGVDKIEVRLKERKVRVEHDPARSTIDQMLQALGEAGYDSRAGA